MHEFSPLLNLISPLHFFIFHLPIYSSIYTFKQLFYANVYTKHLGFEGK